MTQCTRQSVPSFIITCKLREDVPRTARYIHSLGTSKGYHRATIVGSAFHWKLAKYKQQYSCCQKYNSERGTRRLCASGTPAGRAPVPVLRLVSSVVLGSFVLQAYVLGLRPRYRYFFSDYIVGLIFRLLR